MRNYLHRKRGFTIVEILVVIVVIGIISTIVTVSFNGVQEKNRQKKIESDIQRIVAAIKTARSNTGKNLIDITGYGFSAYPCTILAAGTDLATVSSSDWCIWQYNASMNAIATAAGVTLGNIRDPWGRPYFIDENEGEGGGCSKDTIAVYARPLNGNSLYPSTPANNVPLSGFSGCS